MRTQSGQEISIPRDLHSRAVTEPEGFVHNPPIVPSSVPACTQFSTVGNTTSAGAGRPLRLHSHGQFNHQPNAPAQQQFIVSARSTSTGTYLSSMRTGTTSVNTQSSSVAVAQRPTATGSRTTTQRAGNSASSGRSNDSVQVSTQKSASTRNKNCAYCRLRQIKVSRTLLLADSYILIVTEYTKL